MFYLNKGFKLNISRKGLYYLTGKQMAELFNDESFLPDSDTTKIVWPQIVVQECDDLDNFSRWILERGYVVMYLDSTDDFEMTFFNYGYSLDFIKKHIEQRKLDGRPYEDAEKFIEWAESKYF